MSVLLVVLKPQIGEHKLLYPEQYAEIRAKIKPLGEVWRSLGNVGKQSRKTEGGVGRGWLQVRNQG